MKISSGLSEINFLNQPARPRTEKVYLWPVYNAGKVNTIHGVTRRTESHATYAKPSPEDHLRLLDMAQENRGEEYNASGRLSGRNSLSLQPGTFFDSLA